jgi:hypothetical protein
MHGVRPGDGEHGCKDRDAGREIEKNLHGSTW